jgi:hypothetical protein
MTFRIRPMNTDTHRLCSECQTIFELNETNFYKKYTGFHYQCRPCFRDISKEIRIKNKGHRVYKEKVSGTRKSLV